MKRTLYYIVAHENLNAVLVLDKQGTLYYAGVGTDDEQLVSQAKDDYKRSGYSLMKMVDPNERMQKTIDMYVAMVKDPRAIDEVNKKIPMYMGGTTLQKQVWDHLIHKTTYDSTTTYGDIAAQLGIPRASRAVGSCCGSNKISLAIPCHRVLAKTGKITGYKWGVEIKEQLLAMEHGTS